MPRWPGQGPDENTQKDNEALRRLFFSIKIVLINGRPKRYRHSALAKETGIHWQRVNRFMARDGDNLTVSEKRKVLKVLNAHRAKDVDHWLGVIR